MKANPTKNIAAIYARVSSDRQREDRTIESQTQSIRDYSKRNGYAAPEELALEDDGYSGDSLTRPGLERLRDLAAECQIEVILILSPDRLSRRYAYQVLLLEEFHRNGVDVVFLNSVKGETPEEKLLLQFQGMIAEYERAQILERSRRGKRHKAKQGNTSVLSGAPYGYRYIKNTQHAESSYEIIEEEAAIVRRVYESYSQELRSIGAIARMLTDENIPTKKGKARWDRSVVWAMLRNPAYTGKAAFGKTKSCQRRNITRPLRRKGGYSTRCSASKEQPKDQWIYIPVPTIVCCEQFELAQQRLEDNKLLSSRNAKEHALLQGIVHCEECGYAYYITSTRTTKQKIR